MASKRPMALAILAVAAVYGCGDGSSVGADATTPGTVVETTQSATTETTSPRPSATTSPVETTQPVGADSSPVERESPATVVSETVVLPSGLFCRDLPDLQISYVEAVSYWISEGLPGRMDADSNGIPCETVYPATEVVSFWAEPPAADSREPSTTTAPAAGEVSTTSTAPGASEVFTTTTSPGLNRPSTAAATTTTTTTTTSPETVAMPPGLPSQLSVVMSAQTARNCGVDLEPSSSDGTAATIEVLEVFSLCGHGWDPQREVVITVHEPGGSEILGGTVAVEADGTFWADYLPLPFYPTGRYLVIAEQGGSTGSDWYDVVPAEESRLQVFAATQPGASQFTPLTREGGVGDTFWFGLTGYAGNASHDLTIYSVDSSGEPRFYVTLPPILTNPGGGGVLQITAEASDPVGVYCVQIEATADPSGIDCEQAGFELR